MLCDLSCCEKGEQGVKAGSVVTNGAGLCYLVRCVGTHQVPLDRISYLEAAFHHPVINLTVHSLTHLILQGSAPPMLKYRQNTPLRLILSLEGQQFWGVEGTCEPSQHQVLPKELWILTACSRK